MTSKSNIFILSVVLIALFAVNFTSATEVKACEGFGGFTRQVNSDEVQVNNCQTGTCKLKRKTKANIMMKFVAQNNYKNVTTTVFGRILELPLPFIGVDGTSACNNFFKEDGVTKISCPLKKGETYVYKNSFDILEAYPKVRVQVHWALTDTKTNQDIFCFEIPARLS